jgi:hypothetical protein
MQKPPENLGAWEAYQQALWHWSKQGSGLVSLARDFLHRAAVLDPRFAQPHALLA